MLIENLFQDPCKFMGCLEKIYIYIFMIHLYCFNKHYIYFLSLAGMESIFFIAAHTVMCFASVTKIVLKTQQYFVHFSPCTDLIIFSTFLFVCLFLFFFPLYIPSKQAVVGKKVGWDIAQKENPPK